MIITRGYHHNVLQFKNNFYKYYVIWVLHIFASKPIQNTQIIRTFKPIHLSNRYSTTEGALMELYMLVLPGKYPTERVTDDFSTACDICNMSDWNR